MKKNFDIQLIELIMAQADKNRCFVGSIKREKDESGTPYVFGKIKIHKGSVISRAENQDQLFPRLDELTLLHLDYGLHDIEGVSSKIFSTDFFHN